jgi:Arm DNA-binding domain
MQGHVHKRVHSCEYGRRTPRWYVVVDVEPRIDRRRRQKSRGGFRTRREAEVVQARLVNDLHNHGYVVPTRLTLGEWVQDSWLPMMQTRVKPTTLSGYRASVVARPVH